MAIFELYSTRKKAAESAGKADVYSYTEISSALRVQVQQIVAEAIGVYSPDYNYNYTRLNNNSAWDVLDKALCREFGVHQLGEQHSHSMDDIVNFLGQSEIDGFLDAVELLFLYISKIKQWSENERKEHGITVSSADAIDELNYRFKKSGLGYSFVGETLIRIDSEFIHAEAVKPALSLLHREGFEGPEKEFLQAHRHYRAGDHKDAVTWANKAFESTMKAICDRKGWSYDAGARASDLLKIMKQKRLWPDYLDGSFDQLVATLQSGLPQVRNEAGAHGDGAIPKSTPAYVAAYALHLAASKIVLMVEAAA